MIYKIFLLLICLIFYNYRNLLENHVIYNKLYKSINKKYRNKLLYTNKLTDGIVQKLGSKIFCSNLFSNKNYFPKTYVCAI